MKILKQQFIDEFNDFTGTTAQFHKHLEQKFSVTLDKSTVHKRVNSFRSKGFLDLDAGVSVQQGTILSGISRYHKLDDGGIWVKSDVDKSKALDGLKSAVTSLAESLPARTLANPDTFDQDTDCLTVYTIGDAHIGMLAHEAETGADSDLKTVEHDLIKAMSMLVSQSNCTDECLIIDVGDFFHADNQSNTTAHSGNKLDVDGRYHKVLEIGLNLTIELIELALSKHNIVRWRSAIGNHNEHSAIMTTCFIKAYFHSDPRVIVHDTPNMFMYHQFGSNLIGITHGHTCKPDKLGEIMSVDCQSIWSSTTNRYWYTGHIHHQSVKEYPSCVVETFRTLAGKDAWHSAAGYRSGQDMRAITLHKQFGEISRNTVNIAAIRS